MSLAIYISALVLVTGLLPNTRLRATLYSLPLPMAIVLLNTGIQVGSQQIIGVLLLALFLGVAGSSSLLLSGWLAVPIGAATYILLAALLSGWEPQPVWLTFVMALFVWVITAMALVVRRDPVGRAPSQGLGWRRVLIVAVASVVAVSLRDVLSGYLVTFPFAGVVVALDNRSVLPAFARSFALFGVPGLLAFIYTTYLTQSALGIPIAVVVGFVTWGLVTLTASWFGRVLMPDDLDRIASIIGRDPGVRGVNALQNDRARREQLSKAVSLIRTAQEIVIVTGFPIPSSTPVRAETDGPAGSVALASCIARRGTHVRLVTDPISFPVVESTLRAASKDMSVDALASEEEMTRWRADAPLDLVIFVERPGPNAEGQYRSMSGLEIPDSAPLELLASGVKSIGVGDGGNEVGMGRVADLVRRSINHGAEIACVTSTDALIVAGTSNWGAFGLIAALAVADADADAPELEVPFNRQLLRGSVLGQAIDGISLKSEESVDGLAQNEYESVIEALSAAVARAR